ncbi:hypothetical protein DSM104443_03816 [Usitatibacter rugosus]|uniref:Ig-like domain-containing protein n=1 Tax=Usitatibacter rugosus TaxID=2732067 RepID=A0A6M4H1Z2_9PROT|nr:hypothetical protein [Usitatibacter rugosus]QJR12723.1 hypothetical protein DSM104443_03816 [Usitatibacter rugosus]
MQPLVRFAARFALVFLFGAASIACAALPADIDAVATAQDSQKRIVVAAKRYTSGYENIVLVRRYTPDGLPDNAFGSAGSVSVTFSSAVTPTAITAGAGDKVVVMAYAGGVPWFVRLNADGNVEIQLAHSFTEGYQYNAITQLANGNYLAGGGHRASPQADSYTAFATLLPNGMLSSAIGSAEAVGQYRALTVDASSGRVVAAGVVRESNGGWSMFAERYQANGNNEYSFGGNGNGQVRIPLGAAAADVGAVVVLGNGKILIGGRSQASGGNPRATLVRLNPNGTVDATFGTGGVLTPTVAVPGASSTLSAITALVRMTTGPNDLIAAGYARDTAAASGTHTWLFDLVDSTRNGDVPPPAYVELNPPAQFGAETVGAHMSPRHRVIVVGNPTPYSQSYSVTSYVSTTGEPEADLLPQDLAPDLPATAFDSRLDVARGSTQDWNIVVQGFAAPLPVTVVNGQWSLNCIPGAYTSSPGWVLTEGSHLCVRHTASSQFSTAVATQVTIGNWSGNATSTTVADPPPQTSIASTPPAMTTSTAATFSFTSSQPGGTFQCSLDQAEWIACATPGWTVSPVSVGPHSLSVRAVNANGTVDPAPPVYAWFVQATEPPETTLGGPTGAYYYGSATFTFTSAPADHATFECAVDAGAFAACASPFTVNLADGPHTMAVRAVRGGLTDPTPATQSVTVDTRVPDTSIQSGPEASTYSRSARFTFASDKPSSTFECSLDGAPFVPCASGIAFADLSFASHAFLVRARDPVDRIDPTPASFTWTVLPDVDPDLAPNALGLPVVAYPVSDILWRVRLGTFNSPIPVTLEALNNGGPIQWSPNCDPMAYTSLAGTIPVGTTYLCLRTIAGGVNYPFQYRVTLGSWQQVIEYTASYIGNLQHLDIVTGPNPVTPSTTATFTLFAHDDPVFECSLDGSDFLPCTSPVTYENMTPGSHAFTVRATGDPLGIPTTSEPVTRTWIVDPAIPVPAEDTSVPDTSITNAWYTDVQTYFASYFFADDLGLGRTFECSMDGAAFVPCPRMSTWGGLPDGPHELAVRAVNPSGVVDPTPATLAFTVNTQAPHITLDTYPPAVSASPSAQFTFHFSKPPFRVQCSLNGSAVADCASGVTYDNLASGSYTFSVRAWDAAGHMDPPTAYSWSVSVDQPPETTIVSGPATQVPEGAMATFTFTSNAPGATFECRLNTVAFGPCANPWTTSALPAGGYTAEVRALDTQGRVDPTPASWTFTVIVEPPRVILDAFPPGVTTSTVAQFAFHFTKPPAGVQCSLNGAAFVDCVSPVSYTNLVPGPYNFRVKAWDAAGNMAPPTFHGWTVQAGPPPDTTITSGPPSLPEGTPAIFTFTSNVPGAAFECRVVGVSPFAPCTSAWTAPLLPPGNYTAEVRAIDATGRPDPSPANRAFIVLPVINTTITSSPQNNTTNTTATFMFISTPAGLMFDCRMDSGAWMACASPRTYAGLTRTTHTFQVRARNPQGQADATPAVYTWTIR